MKRTRQRLAGLRLEASWDYSSWNRHSEKMEREKGEGKRYARGPRPSPPSPSLLSPTNDQNEPVGDRPPPLLKADEMCQSSLVGPLATGPNKTGATTRKLVISRTEKFGRSCWRRGGERRKREEREKRGGERREEEREEREKEVQSRRRLERRTSFQGFSFLPSLCRSLSLSLSLSLLSRGGFANLSRYSPLYTADAGHTLIYRAERSREPLREDGRNQKRRHRSTAAFETSRRRFPLAPFLAPSPRLLPRFQASERIAVALLPLDRARMRDRKSGDREEGAAASFALAATRNPRGSAAAAAESSKRPRPLPSGFSPPRCRRQSSHRIETNKTRFFLRHPRSLSCFSTPSSVAREFSRARQRGCESKTAKARRCPASVEATKWPKHSTPSNSSRRPPATTAPSYPSPTSRRSCSCRCLLRSRTTTG